jgi:hypothetical protein
MKHITLVVAMWLISMSSPALAQFGSGSDFGERRKFSPAVVNDRPVLVVPLNARQGSTINLDALRRLPGISVALTGRPLDLTRSGSQG